jgi:cell division protein FtsB
MNIMEKYTSLGLIVNQNSFIQLFEINSDAQLKSYSGEIAEIRNLSENNALLLQKCDGGYVIRIFVPAGGRNDYMSASISVPCNIEITGRELSEIISSTKNVLQNWRKDTAGVTLTQIFEKKYKTNDVQKTLAGVKTAEIAYRKYGDFYQLYEILNDLYQPYYDAYKMIFLLDTASGVVCNGAANLTNNNIVKNVIINPPASVDGYKPYISEVEFTQPVITYVGQEVKLSWRQKGYKNIDKPVTITSDVKIPIPIPTDYKKLISHKNFHVFDKKGTKIDDYLITINGKEVGKDKCIAVSVSALDAVKIKIFPTDKTLKNYEATVDLLSKDKEKIILTNVTFEYQFHLDGNPEVVLEHKSPVRWESCPIQGYEPLNGTFDIGKNELVYRPFNRKMWITLLLAALLLVLLGFTAGWWFGGMSAARVTEQTEQSVPADDQNTENTESEDPKPEKEKFIEGVEDAKKFLESEKIWKRDLLEGYRELVGLWDALNEYNFEKVQEIQSKINCKPLQDILEKAKNSDKKGPYNSTKNYEITYDDYLKTI